MANEELPLCLCGCGERVSHYIYDHSDLSKYTIKMTRSEHTTFHHNLRALGLEIPRINTGHENIEELKLMEYIKKDESEQTN